MNPDQSGIRAEYRDIEDLRVRENNCGLRMKECRAKVMLLISVTHTAKKGGKFVRFLIKIPSYKSVNLYRKAKYKFNLPWTPPFGCEQGDSFRLLCRESAILFLILMDGRVLNPWTTPKGL